MNIIINLIITLWIGLVLPFAESSKISYTRNDLPKEKVLYYIQQDTNKQTETIDYLLSNQKSIVHLGMVNNYTKTFSKDKIKTLFYFKHKNFNSFSFQKAIGNISHSTKNHAALYANAIDYYIYTLSRILI